jgi:Protein of Unknown function (DUF2784)
MPDRLIADVIVVVHLAFVTFVVAGGLLLLRWPRLAWLHLPAAAWGAYAELTATICPLTPLENRFRQRAGLGGYEGGFVEHYVMPVLYPAGLTPQHQVWLGAFVIALNAAVYAAVLVRARRRRATIVVPSRPAAPPARPSA